MSRILRGSHRYSPSLWDPSLFHRPCRIDFAARRRALVSLPVSRAVAALVVCHPRILLPSLASKRNHCALRTNTACCRGKPVRCGIPKPTDAPREAAAKQTCSDPNYVKGVYATTCLGALVWTRRETAHGPSLVALRVALVIFLVSLSRGLQTRAYLSRISRWGRRHLSPVAEWNPAWLSRVGSLHPTPS